MQKKCPTCNIKLPEERPSSWPFCSNRCRMLDLGKWMNEEYRVPAGNSQNQNTANPENEEDNN